MKIELNINAIRNFVAVAEMGNITNAAEKLYITQPTLSRQISSLERELGVTLLDRMKTGVSLTAAGASFYEQCLPFIRAYDDLMGKIGEFHNIISGSLKIGYQKSSEEMIISLHSGFSKNYPHISIKNVRQSNENFINQLLSDDLDVAYIYGLELQHGYKNIKSVQVGLLKNMALVSADSPYAKRSRIHLSELADAPFIMPSKSNAPYKVQEITNWCQKYGFKPKTATTAVSIIDYILGVIQYNGVAILPYMRNMDDSRSVKYLELEGYSTEYPVHIAWNSTNSNSVLPVYLSYIEQQPMFMPPVPDIR